MPPLRGLCEAPRSAGGESLASFLVFKNALLGVIFLEISKLCRGEGAGGQTWTECYKNMYDNRFDHKIADIIQCADAA